MLDDLIRLSNYSLLAIGESVAFQVLEPGNGQTNIILARRREGEEGVELDNPTPDQLRGLVSSRKYSDRVKDYLLQRANVESPGRFRSRIGIDRLTFERRDIGQRLQIDSHSLSFWFDQEFNRRILVDPNDQELVRLRRAALDMLLKPHDNHLPFSFPSTLFVEIALITADDKLLLLRKSRDRSALAKTGRVWTCTIEEGLLWDDQNGAIDYRDSVLSSLVKELELGREVVQSVRLTAVGLEYTHLNTALLGFAVLSLDSAKLEAVLRPKIQARKLRDFQEMKFLPLEGALEACLGKGKIWHPTALLRIYLLQQSRSRR